MTHLMRCLIDRKEHLSVTINITTRDAAECSCLNASSVITSTSGDGANSRAWLRYSRSHIHICMMCTHYITWRGRCARLKFLITTWITWHYTCTFRNHHVCILDHIWTLEHHICILEYHIYILEIYIKLKKQFEKINFYTCKIPRSLYHLLFALCGWQHLGDKFNRRLCKLISIAEMIMRTNYRGFCISYCVHLYMYE